MVRHLSQSIIHPVQEWLWSQRKNRFCDEVRVTSLMTNLSSAGLPVFVPNIPSDFHTWEDHLSSMFQSENFEELASNTSLHACLLHIERAQRCVLTFRFDFPRTFRCSGGKYIRIPHAVSWHQIHHWLWFCCDSFFTCIFWCSFRHRFKIIDGTDMVDVEQAQKMIPFITCEVSLCQYVCELVFGVNVFDLDLGIQIDSVKQTIKNNSVGSGNMTHCLTSSLYDHLDHCLVVFKHIQQSFLTRRIDVWGNEINIVWIINPMNFVSRWRLRRISPHCITLIRVSVKIYDDQIP